MSFQQLSSTDPEGLEMYFTDVEHLREFFRQSLTASTLAKRLFVIHGVGGVGKSSLLRMFRLYCKSTHIPVGLASGDEVKSAVEVFSTWTNDLKTDSVSLPMFVKTLTRYRSIQAKVNQQANKKLDMMGKATAKTVETAVGMIPVVGPIVSTLGGASVEALIDWLRGFLSKPDIDLLLDPTDTLTDDFLVNISRVASKQRIVLLLDTFEQMTGLNDWTCSLAQQLHPNVLLVIAGRAMPNWNRRWPGWLTQAQVEELKPMTEDIMHTLAHRYYSTMHGGEPELKQIKAIIHFARGLPMVVTSAMKLWIQYGIEDFAIVKPQVVADLVDRLMEGVPKELHPALEAAAVVRWFNKEILRTLIGQTNVNTAYDELRRFPFVRPRVEGLSLHDTVREMLDENLRVHDPERHDELHKKAAVYFEAYLTRVESEKAERLSLEYLYHHIRANEEMGIRLFQNMAEELTCYRQINRLRALLNDVNNYLLEHENSRLWRDYYRVRLAHLEARLIDAEKVYQAIGQNERVETKLRAYALCDWGEIVTKKERLGQSGGIEKALNILGNTQKVAPQIDSKLIFVFSYFSNVYIFKGDFDRGLASLEKQKQFCLTESSFCLCSPRKKESRR